MDRTNYSNIGANNLKAKPTRDRRWYRKDIDCRKRGYRVWLEPGKTCTRWMPWQTPSIHSWIGRLINWIAFTTTWRTLKPRWRGNSSVYDRAEKHLRYFARQVYTDRLMICLIVIIVIAIVTIIVLKIIGKTPQVSIDQLKWSLYYYLIIFYN